MENSSILHPVPPLLPRMWALPAASGWWKRGGRGGGLCLSRQLGLQESNNIKAEQFDSTADRFCLACLWMRHWDEREEFFNAAGDLSVTLRKSHSFLTEGRTGNATSMLQFSRASCLQLGFGWICTSNTGHYFNTQPCSQKGGSIKRWELEVTGSLVLLLA